MKRNNDRYEVSAHVIDQILDLDSMLEELSLRQGTIERGFARLFSKAADELRADIDDQF